MRRSVKIAGQKTRLRSREVRRHRRQEFLQCRHSRRILLVDHEALSFPFAQAVGTVGIGCQVAVEEVCALAGSQLDCYAASAAGGNVLEDSKAADNGGVTVGRG